jgi:hypothetical protein
MAKRDNFQVNNQSLSLNRIYSNKIYYSIHSYHDERKPVLGDAKIKYNY